MKTYILDTNVLLDDLYVSTRLSDEFHRVVILQRVFDEIDKLKSDGDPQTGYLARKLSKEIGQITQTCERQGNGYLIAKTPNFILEIDLWTEQKLHSSDLRLADSTILRCTEIYNGDPANGEVYLVTHDRNLRTKATSLRIPTINPAEWIEVEPNHYRLPLASMCDAIGEAAAERFSINMDDNFQLGFHIYWASEHQRRLQLDFQRTEQESVVNVAGMGITDFTGWSKGIFNEDPFATSKSYSIGKSSPEIISMSFFFGQRKILVQASNWEINDSKWESKLFQRLTLDVFLEKMTERELDEYVAHIRQGEADSRKELKEAKGQIAQLNKDLEKANQEMEELRTRQMHQPQAAPKPQPAASLNTIVKIIVAAVTSWLIILSGLCLWVMYIANR